MGTSLTIGASSQATPSAHIGSTARSVAAAWAKSMKPNTLEQCRRVALKLLRHRFRRPDDRARFLAEGQLAAAVNHPNCVYVFEMHEIAGIPVIAMELLPGGTLKDRVNEWRAAAAHRGRGRHSSGGRRPRRRTRRGHPAP